MVLNSSTVWTDLSHSWSYTRVSIATHCFGISNADSQGCSQRRSTASYGHRPTPRNFARRCNYLADPFPRMVFAQSRLVVYNRKTTWKGNSFLEKRQFNKVVHLLAGAISIQSKAFRLHRSRRNKQLTEIITFEHTLTGVTSVDFLTVVTFTFYLLAPVITPLRRSAVSRRSLIS